MHMRLLHNWCSGKGQSFVVVQEGPTLSTQIVFTQAWVAEVQVPEHWVRVVATHCPSRHVCNGN